MRGFRGDFLGFTFNNVHSSALGITRVLNGMMDIQLTPTQNDISVELNGQDGKHYYGSTYKQINIVINFAFEGLSDEQISVIKTIWNDKKVHQLILDEYPYKVYNAKASGSSVLKHLSFSKTEGGRSIRYYNGEGSFNFTCFFPYAISRFSYIEEYVINNIPEWVEDMEENDVLTLYGIVKDKIGSKSAWIHYYQEETQNVGQIYGKDSDLSNMFVNSKIMIAAKDLTLEETSKIYKVVSKYDNLSAWAEACGLPSLSDGYGVCNEVDGALEYKIKNPGDANAILKINFNLADVPYGIVNKDTATMSVAIKQLKRWIENEETQEQEIASFEINNLFKNNETDSKLTVDFYNGILKGSYEEQLSKELYNQFMSGDFFVIEPNEEYIIKISMSDYGSTNKVSLAQLAPLLDIQYLYN